MGQNPAAEKYQGVEIYLELNSLNFTTPNRIKGSIYINAIEYSRYSELILRVECLERTHLKQNRRSCIFGKEKESSQQRNTYLDEVVISQFPNGLYQGFHEFRFTYALDQNLTGSVYFSEQNFVQYQLRVCLLSTEIEQFPDKVQIQQIWINEHFRSISEALIVRSNLQPRCCMWGYGFGYVQIELKCDKNLVRPGESLTLSCKINTNKTFNEIKCASIKVLQRKVIIVEDEVLEVDCEQYFSHDFNGQKILPGQSKSFEKTVEFPVNMYPTAIGQMLARFYVIEVKCQMACWTEATLSIPIFVLSTKYDSLSENLPKFKKPRKLKSIIEYTHKSIIGKKYLYESNPLMPVINQHFVGSSVDQNPMVQSERNLL